jgi:hypothetical protein
LLENLQGQLKISRIILKIYKSLIMAIQPDHFWSHNTMRDSPFKDSGAHKRKMELIKGWRSSLKNGGSHRRKTEVIQKLKHRKEK